MTRHASRPVRSLRILVVTLALLLVSTLVASADSLVPAVDTGGAGGGGGSATVLDEMARSQELSALTPSGSIATSSDDDTLTAAEASHENMKVVENALAAAELEAATHPNTQSIARIEGLNPSGTLAGAPSPVINGRGQVAYEETERALAQNAVAVAELEAATHPNAKSTARAEDVLAVGGVLAGGDELTEVPQATTPYTAF